MRIDSISVLLSSGAVTLDNLTELGMKETCRRPYPRLGIEAFRYCLQNMRLSFLKIADENAFYGSASQLMGLPQRMMWQQRKALPFGIGLRAETEDEPPPFPIVNIEETLDDSPNDASPVLAASESDQALLFATRACDCIYAPGSSLAAMPGFGPVKNIHLEYPHTIPPSAELHFLASKGLISLAMVRSDPRMILTIGREGKSPLLLDLPDGSCLS